MPEPRARHFDKYTTENLKAIGRTKAQVLRSLKAYPVATMDCGEIEAQHLIELAQILATDEQPQTVGNDMSHMASVFSIARPAWGYSLNAQAMEDAQTVAKRLDGPWGETTIDDRVALLNDHGSSHDEDRKSDPACDA